MARKTFRAHIETLERRETPTASPGLHALASREVAVRGSGSGRVTSETLLPTSVALTAAISGSDAREGGFLGQVNGQIFISKPTSSATGTATLTAAPGNSIELSLGGAIHVPKRSSTETGTFSFSVVGGTGVFAGATGHGFGSGSIDTTNGVLRFNYHGKIRP